MAVLSWGKPKIEIVKYVDGAMPATPTWVATDVPVENSSKLTTTKGNKKEAKQEGGTVVDVRVDANSYTFEMELFAKKGATKPIEDADGVVIDNYAIRLTPEDVTVEGWQLDKTNVSVEETWDAENGKKWKYTFEGIKPATGNILKPYTQA